jgi:hypothetical protein
MEIGEINDEVDYKNPAFILQNLSSLKFDAIGTEPDLLMRNQTIKHICAQVCFYTMCALRAFQGVIKAPRILIYGAGVVGSKIIEHLVEHGCISMLRVYLRNEKAVEKWKHRGIKASDTISKLLKAGTFEIVITTANAASFAQFTRDLFGKISSKTCVISAVFGLQRTRIYQLLKTPCVFRTFTERSDVLTGQSIILNGDISKEQLIREAANIVCTRIIDFKKHILLLENYYVLWGMNNEDARREAINISLGDFDVGISTKTIVDIQDSSINNIHLTDIEHSNIVSEHQESLHGTEEEIQNKLLSVTLHLRELLPHQKLGLLDNAIIQLKRNIGIYFQEEMSRVARIGDLAQFSSFKWDEENGRSHIAPRLLGDMQQTSFEIRNKGIVTISVNLTEAELKAIYLCDSMIPNDYYIHPDILIAIDTETEVTMTN